MKQKVKDITFGELSEYCRKRQYCENCPLYEFCDNPAILHRYLETEVDLDEQTKKND